MFGKYCWLFSPNLFIVMFTLENASEMFFYHTRTLLIEILHLWTFTIAARIGKENYFF